MSSQNENTPGGREYSRWWRPRGQGKDSGGPKNIPPSTDVAVADLAATVVNTPSQDDERDDGPMAFRRSSRVLRSPLLQASKAPVPTAEENADSLTPKRTRDAASPAGSQRETPPKRCRESQCLKNIAELGKILDDVLDDINNKQVRHITLVMKTKLARVKDLQADIGEWLNSARKPEETDRPEPVVACHNCSQGGKKTESTQRRDAVQQTPKVWSKDCATQTQAPRAPTTTENPQVRATNTSAKNQRRAPTPAEAAKQGKTSVRGTPAASVPKPRAPNPQPIGPASEGPEAERGTWRTFTRKKRRKKNEAPHRSRPDAVIIAAKGKTYSEILAMVTRRDNSQLAGLGNCVKKVRRTTNGNLLLEMAKDSAESAASMRTSIAQVLGDTAEVRTMSEDSKVSILEIRELDALTKEPEIVAAIAEQFSLDGAKVKVRSLRPGYAESQTAIISLPCPLAKAVLKRGSLRIGWTSCTIRERTGPPRCYRCLEAGHLASNCKSVTDRSGCCIRCGESGHKAAKCPNEQKCFLCAASGKNKTRHQAGSKSCPSRSSSSSGAGPRNAPCS
ncbi:uncharacterized protein [Drosophila kikkawai]|uniref:CCHC-type domain-containing protein n=1 Tax=Drosophila kikkawai TaxID=30033 RepID=A0ABM4GB65_DROKI